MNLKVRLGFESINYAVKRMLETYMMKSCKFLHIALTSLNTALYFSYNTLP